MSTPKNAIFLYNMQVFCATTPFCVEICKHLCYNVSMSKKQNKKLIFNLLLPLCKNKEGNFDTAKTADCKKMVKNFGVVAMALGTILLLVGFVGLVIKNTLLSLDVAWYWVAVGFGTAFTCIGIGSINTATNLSTYVNNQLNPQENTSEQE